MFEKYDDVLTVIDVAEILFVGRNTVYDLLNTGHLKGFRIGRSWRVPKSSLDDYILGKCKSIQKI